jgi:hypothetical protein
MVFLLLLLSLLLLLLLLMAGSIICYEHCISCSGYLVLNDKRMIALSELERTADKDYFSVLFQHGQND